MTGSPRGAVFVEGLSDRLALEAVARRRGRDLAAEGVWIVPMDGAHGIGRFLERFGPRGLAVRLGGLCDAGEEGDVRRGLERAGLGSGLTRAAMEALGFYVCEPDLEGELIRALGVPAVERVLAAEGDLGSFRTLQREPFWRERRTEDQLRRFMGSGARRKIRYAGLLVDALDPRRVPRPLDRVVARI